MLNIYPVVMNPDGTTTVSKTVINKLIEMDSVTHLTESGDSIEKTFDANDARALHHKNQLMSTKTQHILDEIKKVAEKQRSLMLTHMLIPDVVAELTALGFEYSTIPWSKGGGVLPPYMAVINW